MYPLCDAGDQPQVEVMNRSVLKSLAASRLAQVFCLVSLIFGAACTTPYDPLQDFAPVSPATELEVPPTDAPRAEAYPTDQLNQGRYMVGLLGCAICHTDGALIGKPDYALNLAGSGIGIAYTNPLVDHRPAVVFPPNITPDLETGIGRCSQGELVRLLRSGEADHGRHLLAVMPWPTYASIKDSDALAIAAYLLSLPPVKHQVPDNVPVGAATRFPYVHFGVYRSRH